MLSTKARAQVTIDSVQVNGQTTTTVANGQTIRVYMTPITPLWATYNPSQPMHFAFWGSLAPVVNTTPRELQEDSGWVFSITLNNPNFTGTVSTLSLLDNSNGILSNYYMLNISQVASVNEISAQGEIESVTYYNFNGVEVQPDGLVVKRTKFISGKIITTKVFIK